MIAGLYENVIPTNKTIITMKKLLLSITLCALAKILLAQPGYFNYQAAVRNADGEIIANQNVSFKIEILQGSPDGSVVYRETHDTITNAMGLATLKIFGGRTEEFWPPVDWSTDNYYIKVYLDSNGGTDFVEMGTSQLLSVPYAMHAGTVATEKQILKIDGEQLGISSGNTINLPNEYERMKLNDVLYIGNNGVNINEIIVLEGKTDAVNNFVDIDLPKDYNVINTHVLSVEITYVNKWLTYQYGLGYSGSDGIIGYFLNQNESPFIDPYYRIRINYPSELKEMDLRVVLMKANKK
jgi:hypothetical protein